MIQPFGDAVVASSKASDLSQLFDVRDVSNPRIVARYGGSGLSSTTVSWRRVAIDGSLWFLFRLLIHVAGSSECQLIAWSAKEETLRMFAVEPAHIQVSNSVVFMSGC